MTMLQMTWQTNLLKSLKRKYGSPPLGLRNLGNTCYLNSVLQCLTYTPPLANFCLRSLHSTACAGKGKKGECPFCILERRIALSLSSDSVSDSPLRINNCLRLYAEHFRTGRQEDAHEFLRYVIDACHNTCLRLKKLQQQQKGKTGTANGGDISGSTETVVKDIFGGAFQSQVKCLSCGYESNKIDEIMDISLDIMHSGSLKEALQKFFQPEVLDGNNKYKCDNCKELVAARKQMSVLQAPNVLVIQLKRFDGMFGGKVDKTIAFDESLVLSSHMCKGSKLRNENIVLDQHPEYNLFGTIVHSGFSPDSGHYYAYIKNATGRWFCCNDSYVSVSTLHEVLSEKAYILFFSRTKQRPRIRTDLVDGSKSHESNVSKTSVMQKPVSLDNHGPGYLEKLVKMKISANHSETNGSTNPHVSNGTKMSTVQRSELAGAPTNKEGCSDSTEIHKSGVLAKPLVMKESSNCHIQTGNIMKSEVDMKLPIKAGSSNGSGINNKLLAPGNKENGFTGKSASVDSVKREKVGFSINAKNNGMNQKSAVQIMKKAPTPFHINNGENGRMSVDSKDVISETNGSGSMSGSHKRPNIQGLQSAGIMGSGSSCVKRKIENGPSTIFLSRDDQSREEVDAFKEMIEKEASKVLRSCGWSEDVQSFMHARKKSCQGSDSGAPNDLEMKKLLVSEAKRKFLSQVPESLKARLVEQLKLFSQGKKSSGT